MDPSWRDGEPCQLESPRASSHDLLVPHYLSVVAPDYALRPETRIEDCGVHVFEPSRGYRRLTNEEIAARVKVIPGAAAPFLTVGP